MSARTVQKITGLGQFRDSKKTLKAAIDYLNRS